MTVRLLLIDDDARLPELLAAYFRNQGIDLVSASSGAIGLKRLESEVFDAVLLDVMMPGLDGLETLRRIRVKGNMPVIMLTARGDETDRVIGLELGADDYLPKPFSPRELHARLKAVLRRAKPNLESSLLRQGSVEVDVEGRSVQVAGQLIDLTGIEFDLLVALMRRAGRVTPRDRLLQEAGRGDVVVSERTVDVHIAHLRQKLGESAGAWIRTVRGVGYVFANEN